MDYEERRKRQIQKIRERQRILESCGTQGGVLYEKHIEKLQKSMGYMAKHGTLLHYARGSKRPSQKTRKRNSWGGTENWSYKDISQFDDIEAQMDDLIDDIEDAKNGLID